MSILKAGKAAKSYYDKLKRAQAKRDKEIKEKTPPSARRDMGSSTREQRRKNRKGPSGLKVGTEEKIGQATVGATAGGSGAVIVGGYIENVKRGQKEDAERKRKQKEKEKKNKEKPTGVGKAERGFGKAMNNNG